MVILGRRAKRVALEYENKGPFWLEDGAFAGGLSVSLILSLRLGVSLGSLGWLIKLL